MQPFAFLESVISRGLGPDDHVGRLAALVTGDLERAARHLAGSTAPVVIVTGPPVATPDGPVPETDGLLGALSLASTLAASGRAVRFAADPGLAPSLQGLGATTGVDASVVAVAARGDGHGLFPEDSGFDVVCVGRAQGTGSGPGLGSGARSPTGGLAPLDQLVRRGGGGRSIAVARGPHDAGMGRIPAALLAEMGPPSPAEGTVAPCDDLIVSGASCWGAWALTAGIGLADTRLVDAATHALTPAFVSAACERAHRLGARDRTGGDHPARMAGVDWDAHLAMLAAIGHLLDPRLR